MITDDWPYHWLILPIFCFSYLHFHLFCCPLFEFLWNFDRCRRNVATRHRAFLLQHAEFVEAVSFL